ncbi:thioredoxin domain-containing protein [Desmospora profundinema]|uniref:Uncharacterized protein YyaL (SSP411 family) n=1 Tax=Desmospora profundinema TaxID=1571184 RepID=A0ABU1IPG2_9BACL|nr:thioredoxin domain-containing protein [Desmospora profundinema]MDR6226682.1 uncharacterized protein YyaL (SSP411 family) [Desmospora profundinema]
MSEPNRLIEEKSPYLLQHAHNPVDWYPWSEEAFEKARKEDKPVFLSIGYSTCHWCHVMERESFEDEEVAELLNREFVSVKVDREERPDVDHLYMSVCQALTGHGGWPLTVILTPEQKPFFAGTYFPKENRMGHRGLMEILERIAQAWKQERVKIEDVGHQITDALQTQLTEMEGGELSPEIIGEGFQQFQSTFDDRYGGFGSAPKFPRPHDFLFLLRYWREQGEPKALAMVEHTLEAMRRGGIFDHIGFGFARYSVDEKWLVPHFEKMLYDNALLALAYLEAYQATGKERYAQVAQEIFAYVLRDMTDAKGGFYSAEDADSEGEEGKFYVWTPEEIHEVLGEEKGARFCDSFDITAGGNFEEKSIPNQIGIDLAEVASRHGMEKRELAIELENARQQLFQVREKRIHPHKDDKILTSWNGLMIAALARGARVLGDESYRQAAERAVSFLLNELTREDGRLLARYRDGEAAIPAYLDDYANLTWGLLELYEATFDAVHLETALELTESMLDLFGDDGEGGLFFTGKDAERLLARNKEVYDGATPSGNAVAAFNLVRIAHLTGSTEWRERSDRQLKAFGGTVKRSPTAFSFFLTALQGALGTSREIVIAGRKGDPATREMLQAVQQAYLPEAVLLFRSEGETETLDRIAPFTKEQNPVEGRPTAYVCQNQACRQPVHTVDELKNQLDTK